MATGFVQHHTGRPSVGNISVARQSNMSYNLDDLRASIARAGARGSGMSNFKIMEPVTRRGLDSISSSPAGFPALGPAPCKPGRRHSRRQASSKKGRAAVPVTAAAVAAASKAAAAGGIASAWVWGQGAPKVPAVDAGSAHRTVDQKQQQGLQQPHGEPEQCDNAGHVAGNKKPSDMQRMFAGSSSSSFESTCSTEALTVSNTSSPKDANFDDPFLNHLSDFSLRFPEPPTRPPVASPPSSSSKALAISGWGKHITSSIPSVQLLLPPSWRRRLRANGTNNKRCRKSTARWIARSKATSSMSESSLLARALSMNDTVSSQPYNRRGKETAGAVVDAAGAAAETPVCHKSAPTPRLAEMTELTEEQSPSPVGVSRGETDQGKDQQDQEQVQKQPEGQQQEQQQQQQQKEDEEMERLQEQLERQLQQLLLANKEETEQQPQPQPQPQQRQQQQVDLEQPREDQPRSVDAPPSALPTPFRFGDRAQLQQSPPPAPLWTAPRPPLSRERQRQQLSNATAMLAARHSSNRRYYFGSSSGSSTPRGQGSSRCSSRCSSTRSRSSSGTKENRLASWSTTPGLSSPSPTSPAYKLINRLASSSSSIFEEDGDDSKKTKFLNPYVRLPVRAPRPKAVAAPSAPPAGPSGSAAAAEPVLRGPPRQTPSGTWVWGGRSPRASSAATCTEQQQQVQQQQQQQQRKNMFRMDAGGDSFMSNRRRRRAGLTALHVEINRRDARAFGDNRRRLKSGDSGIWLPSPDIWSSARRPTPLNGELFTAW